MHLSLTPGGLPSRFLILVLSGLCLIQNVAWALANPIHVSPSGNDAHEGSERAPLRTIGAATAQAQAGDTILLHDGHYLIDEPIRFAHSGQPDNWIVLQAAPDEAPVIDGQNLTHNALDGTPFHRAKHGLITIEGVSHIRIDGLEVANSHNIGILVIDSDKSGGTHDIEIVRCRTRGSFGSGIAVWYGDRVEIHQCDIQGANRMSLAVGGVWNGRETPHEALTLAGATHFNVHHNTLSLCDKEGIDCKEVSRDGVIHHNVVHNLKRQGIYLDSWFGTLRNVVVYSNIVYECEWGLGLSAEGEGSKMEHIRIHDNLLFHNRASGIIFGVWNRDELREDCALFNNTIVANGSPGHWAGLTGGIDLRSSNLRRLQVFNNVILENFAFAIGVDAKLADPQLVEKEWTFVNNLLSETLPRDPIPSFFNIQMRPLRPAGNVIEPAASRRDPDDALRVARHLAAGIPSLTLGDTRREGPIGVDFSTLPPTPGLRRLLKHSSEPETKLTPRP